MSTQITLDIPDELVDQAKSLAQSTKLKWTDVVLLALKAQLLEFQYSDLSNQPFDQLADDRVRELAALYLDSTAGLRIHLLLDRQQAGSLTKAEGLELSSLSHIYDLALLVKSQGLAEYVRRGLQPPFKP